MRLVYTCFLRFPKVSATKLFNIQSEMLLIKVCHNQPCSGHAGLSPCVLSACSGCFPCQPKVRNKVQVWGLCNFQTGEQKA